MPRKTKYVALNLDDVGYNHYWAPDVWQQTTMLPDETHKPRFLPASFNAEDERAATEVALPIRTLQVRLQPSTPTKLTSEHDGRSAADRVFGINELTEMIISYLITQSGNHDNIATLLPLLRVNQNFRCFITDSKWVKEALILKPRTVHRGKTILDHHWQFPDLYNAIRLPACGRTATKDNPCCYLHFSSDCSGSITYNFNGACELAQDLGWQTWRRIQIGPSTPQSSKEECILRFHCKCVSGWVRIAVEEGDTLGDVEGKIRKHRRYCHTWMKVRGRAQPKWPKDHVIGNVWSKEVVKVDR